MFRNLPIVLDAQSIIKRSLSKSHKVQIVDRNADFRRKKTIIAKTESFANSLISTLENYVKKFPSIENLPPFYQDLIDIKIDVNSLKKALGAVNWAYKTCNNIYSKQRKAMRKNSNYDFLQKKQQEIYGRLTSVVKQISNELELMAKAQMILKKFPHINDIPTIVIAGYPNVGKSSLLRCLSAAKPEVAQYPFTTKEIYVGHIKKQERYITHTYQIIDTPGLLDRSFFERNKIERQAISALKHLANVIIFLLDPSETCGYKLDDQLSLSSEVKKMFKFAEIIVVETKSDILKTESSNLKISCKTEEGLSELKEKILSIDVNFEQP